MYLNVFVYDTITDSPMALATLVAASALAATVATLLAGALSSSMPLHLYLPPPPNSAQINPLP